jgi:hypothetical protein
MRQMAWPSAATQGGCIIMLLRPVLVAAVITAALFIAPAADAATPGSVQVSGNQLESALPHASYFGRGAKVLSPYSTGGGLQHFPATDNPAKMNCAATSNTMYGDPEYGQTAIAFEGLWKTPTDYTLNIDQFANASTASAMFNAERARAASCRSYSEPPVSGSTEHVSQSVSETRIGGHLTFVVKQETSFSGQPGTLPCYAFVTVDGSDLFTDLIVGITTSQASVAAVTLYMIGKVSALR